MYLEKNKTRAQTRFNLEKKKEKCGRIYWVASHEESEAKKTKRIGKMAHNAKNCSCWMCGNPRNHYKGRIKGRITFGEQKEYVRNDIQKYLKYEI